MYETENGRYRANVVTNDESLKNDVEEFLDNHPDINESELFRRAVRQELQRAMQDESNNGGESIEEKSKVKEE